MVVARLKAMDGCRLLQPAAAFAGYRACTGLCVSASLFLMMK
jgi:hypothetical protein